MTSMCFCTAGNSSLHAPANGFIQTYCKYSMYTATVQFFTVGLFL